MLNRIFGNYLVKMNIIGEDKLNEILPIKKGTLAKASTVAMVTKTLTSKQVEEILEKCDGTNEEFGNVAVEEGYLTEDRYDMLMDYQNNSFVVFIDRLIDEGILDFSKVYPILTQIQQEKKWNDHQLMAMATWNTAAIVDIYVPLRSPQLKSLTIAVVDNLRRYIDPDVYIDKAYVSSQIPITKFACQQMKGDFEYTLYFEGKGDNLLGIANHFAGLKFDTVDEDALDNVGEFINVINGQFATDMSYEDIDIDMASPEYSVDSTTLSNGRLYIIPIHINGCEIKAIYEIHD